MKDTHTADPDIPARPKAIVTTNVAAAGNCVAPSFDVQPQSVTVASGATAVLSASAAGEAGRTVSYQWYEGEAPSKTTPAGSGGSTLTVGALTTTKRYWVEATNTCPGGATASITATVSVCTIPIITTRPADQTITRGQSAAINEFADATEPSRWSWFTVAADGVETPVSGAASASVSVSPTETTMYRATISNDCGAASDEVLITVVDPPTVPTGVAATYNPVAGKITVSWNAASSDAGIAGYLVQRSPDGRNISVAAGVSTFDDSVNLVSGRTYVYRIRSRDVNGVYSPQSAPDLATAITFSDDPALTPAVNGGTAIRAVHILELRQAVDAARAAAGLSAAWPANTQPPIYIQASHFTTLRDRLNEARAVFLLPAVTLAPDPAAGSAVLARTINSLRDGVK